MVKKTIHRAETRGHANYVWLDTRHTFSFSDYYREDRINFGLLRVLNDDVVAPGMGFGSHPHNNMEIISIPLKGSLEHRDNTGAESVIKTNDVQLMSAGSGVVHSEYNHSKFEEVNFLQIWVIPKVRDVSPRYQQRTFDPSECLDNFKTIISPDENHETLQINQDAWFSTGILNEGFESSYRFHSDNTGLYVFVIRGKVEIEGELLKDRDGAGFWQTKELTIKAVEKSELLLIEVPMVQ